MKIFYILVLSIFCLAGAANDNIKVLTYNVLADKNYRSLRIVELLKLISKEDADILAFQEATSWFIEDLKTFGLLKKYHACEIKNKVQATGGLLILSKNKISNLIIKHLYSRQSRMLLVAETKIKGVTFKIATCHLESPLDSGGLRAIQLAQFFKELKDKPNCIFMGDFNFGDKETPESKALDKNYKDIWLALHKDQKGFTWNIEESPMAKAGSFPNEKSRRLDRILFKSEILKPVSCKIIGNKPVKLSKEIFPSDHFGLVAEFKIIAKK